MKTLQGIVKSLKNEKTAHVSVESQWQHPIYKKYVKRSKSYASHVEGIDLKEGDTVLIVETKPISKTKRFKVVEKVEVK